MPNPLSIGVVLLLWSILAGGAAVRCTNPRPSPPTTNDMDLKGIWIKLTQTDCGGSYPAQLEFKANDRYSAQADVGATRHPVWDVGSWTTGPNEISLSTANDAIIRYGVSLKNDVLTIKTPDGCTLDYKRSQRPK